MNNVASEIVRLQDSVSYWFNKGDQYRADECEKQLEQFVNKLTPQEFVQTIEHVR